MRIGSTRVTLDTIVAAFHDGATAEEIFSNIPPCNWLMFTLSSGIISATNEKWRHIYGNANSIRTRCVKNTKPAWIFSACVSAY